MTTINNIARINGALSSWEENGEAFAVTLNVVNKPASIQSKRGRWVKQTCTVNYDSAGNFIGLSGDLKTLMLPDIIADANGTARVSTDTSGNVTGLVGPGGVVGAIDRSVDVRKYWATPAPADESEAIQAAVNANPGREIFFHQARHIFKSTIQINASGTSFIGVNGERVSSNGAELRFEPTTPQPAFRIGTDNAQPWDANSYNGVQRTVFKGLDIQMGGALRVDNLALAGQYAAGCNGIEDWRGGHVRIDDCVIEGFENNFWGIQSDFNHFSGLRSLYSRHGIYAGPRTDQFTIDDLYSFYCDTAVTIDGATMVVLNRPKLIICGSATNYPVVVKQGSTSIVVNQPWCENYSGATNQIGFFQVGVEGGYTSTSAVSGFEVNSPMVGTGVGSPGSVLYLVVLGKAARTTISMPTAGAGISASTNLTALAAFAPGFNHSTSGSTLHLKLADNYQPSKMYANLGTGTATVYASREASTVHTFANNNGRLAMYKFGGAVGSEELRLSTEGAPGQFVAATPTYATGQTIRVQFRRSQQHYASMPVAGTWEAGDYAINQAPSELGSASSKYVILGWLRLTTGSAHVLNTDWAQCRALTGN